MRAKQNQKPSRRPQSGMSLIELMIALTVLVVGCLALMTLVTTSVSSNNRNKLDTTGTMLAQTVLEAIAAQPASQNPTLTIADCNPGTANTWSIATTGAASPGAGANVNSSGNIDFTQLYSAVPANYAMNYVTCGVGGAQVTYDVRWNVQTLTPYTKMITVSARKSNLGTAAGTLPLFYPPITLRTISGQ